MATDASALVDILEIAMNTCCKQHNFCCQCIHLTHCTDLWDRASEQSFNKTFSSQQLRDYIEEFNQLWEKK